MIDANELARFMTVSSTIVAIPIAIFIAVRNVRRSLKDDGYRLWFQKGTFKKIFGVKGEDLE